jgi:hypothetical protein
MRLLTVLFVIILMSGCATGYGPAGIKGGYSDNKLQDDVYQVSFKGNAYTGSEKAKDYALLRASEIALKNDYKYFIVLDGKDSVKVTTYTTPLQAQTNGNIQMNGNTGSFDGTTSFSGGETYAYNKPRTSLTIKCFKEKPTTIEAFIYDAVQIKENLSSKYGIK